MKTKHTPGPWNSKPITGKAAGLVFGTQPGRTYGRTIAHVTDCGGGKTESIANTRLIAAAPNLLSALQEIVRKSYLRPGPHEDFQVHPDLIAQAKAAIAKAVPE